jgi:hypothetical protein
VCVGVKRSLSTVVIAVLLAAFIVGHVFYGWNLYLTLGADGNFWANAPFLVCFCGLDCGLDCFVGVCVGFVEGKKDGPKA